jgi:murein DD-endopeptidase MepM/ murein hydrolase activator NlpD
MRLNGPCRIGATFLITLLAAAVRAEPAQEVQDDARDDGDDAIAMDAPAETTADATASETLAMLEKPSQPQRRRHFSDGPRSVPRARGAALARARTLGIGDHLTTKRLLWTPPGAELRNAVPGAAPRSLLWPVVGGHWGRGFGFTRKIRTELRHNGIDIGAPMGTPVRAAADGLVIYSDNKLDGFGNAVMILHAGGFTTLYGHNLRTTVQPGWYVKRGERIALVGETGMAWGPHVHFELRDNGRWRDPKPLITGYRDLGLSGPLVDLRNAPADEADAPRVKRHTARADEPAKLQRGRGEEKAAIRAKRRAS